MRKAVFITIIALLAGFVLPAQEARRIKITELEKMIAESQAPLVVNFWATFCKPCMEEMPHFQKLGKKYEKEGVKILLVSLDMRDDYPEKVTTFIKKKGIVTPTAWLDETNADYFCPRVDSSWSGAIPATLFVNNKSGYRKFTEEPLSEEELEKELKAVLAD